MTAAQLFDAATRADDNVLPGLARGDFSPLVNWLRTNIYSKGSLLPADQLMTKATGRPLDAAVYERHLRRRYLEEAEQWQRQDPLLRGRLYSGFGVVDTGLKSQS